MKNIICPVCKKAVVGENVYTGETINSGIDWIGKMPVYEMKYDFRKASHISFGKGYICKRCAKQMFPLGVAFKVTNDYHGKRITPFVGPWRNGFFANKDEAQAVADECNKKRYDNYSRVEEIKI